MCTGVRLAGVWDVGPRDKGGGVSTVCVCVGEEGGEGNP